MARYVSYVLQQYGISSKVVNAEALIKVVDDLVDASDTVIVMTHDVAPYTIWDGPKSSPLERWIKAGGFITWSGDCEFYYIGYSNGSKAHIYGVESIVFGRSITADAHVIVGPAKLGFKILPSMEGFVSLRPADASKLHGLEYEVYEEGAADEAAFYDPILIRVGDGAVAKIAMADGLEIDSLRRSILISEFVLNRVFNLGVKLKQPPNFKDFPKLVIGEYHNWYSGPPEWRHWRWDGPGPCHDPERILPDGRRDIAAAFYPLTGPYNSFDERLVEYHIMLAKACGIDVFAIDWYGPQSFEDYALLPLFKAAEERNFTLVIEYEPKIHFLWVPHPSREEALEAVKNDIKYLFENYAWRKACLRFQGKPVIFFFGVGFLSVDEWCDIFGDLRQMGYDAFYIGDIADPRYFLAFNGLYEWINYGDVIAKGITPAERLKEVSRMFNSSVAFFPDRLFGAGVWPGFNDTGVWDGEGGLEFTQGMMAGSITRRGWLLSKVGPRGLL